MYLKFTMDLKKNSLFKKICASTKPFSVIILLFQFNWRLLLIIKTFFNIVEASLTITKR